MCWDVTLSLSLSHTHTRFRGRGSLNFYKEYLFGFETLVFATLGILSMHNQLVTLQRERKTWKSHHMTPLRVHFYGAIQNVNQPFEGVTLIFPDTKCKFSLSMANNAAIHLQLVSFNFNYWSTHTVCKSEQARAFFQFQQEKKLFD